MSGRSAKASRLAASAEMIRVAAGRYTKGETMAELAKVYGRADDLEGAQQPFRCINILLAEHPFSPQTLLRQIAIHHWYLLCPTDDRAAWFSGGKSKAVHGRFGKADMAT